VIVRYNDPHAWHNYHVNVVVSWLFATMTHMHRFVKLRRALDRALLSDENLISEAWHALSTDHAVLPAHLHVHCSYADAINHTCIRLSGISWLRRDERLSWLSWLVYLAGYPPQTVTNLSTDRAWRWRTRWVDLCSRHYATPPTNTLTQLL